jgi:hypothetical protein
VLLVDRNSWTRQDDVFGVARCRLTRHHRLSGTGWTGRNDDGDAWVFEQNLVQTVRHSYFKNVGFFYTMNFTMIDNELAILHDGEVEHVFERASLSRAAYQYMIQWIQSTKSPVDDPGTMWLEAEKVWGALSPEIQATLMSIAHKESQQARDIRDGLLATLHEYQGVKSIKDSYADCIRACFSQWAN